MSEDNGAPQATGLSSATPIEPASPSRPKASIPSAWPSFEYDADGYPEDEDFAAFRRVVPDLRKAAHWLLYELPRAAENMPCFCTVNAAENEFSQKCVQHIHFSTGGWSGAESLMRLIERRYDLSSFMLTWRRGGHYVFEVPNRLLAPAIEARSDATGTGAAVGESAGPQGGAQ